MTPIPIFRRKSDTSMKERTCSTAFASKDLKETVFSGNDDIEPLLSSSSSKDDEVPGKKSSTFSWKRHQHNQGNKDV